MDPTGVTYNIIILICLLISSAFFSATETALFSVSKLKILSLVDDKIKNADRLNALLEKPDEVLTTILIMNNLINILMSSMVTVLMYSLFGSLGVSIATGVVTILVLIFGEITPKSIAIQNAEKIALKVVRIIEVLIFVLKPLIYIFSKITTLIRKISGSNTEEKDIITHAELQTILEVSEETGVLNNSEKEIIDNLFSFGDKLVKDIMIQRVNVVALDIDMDYDQTIELIKSEKYSRIPVYENAVDNIIGVLNIKDLLLTQIDSLNFNLRDYIREPYQTFEFKKVEDLFKDMKKTKNHIAIVLNEYGSLEGIVTLEDLIETIIGDINDEYDTIEDVDIRQISDAEYSVNGATRLEEVNDVIGLELDSEECDSIGGYIIDMLDRFPDENEQIKHNKVTFSIETLENMSIKRVRIIKEKD